MGASLFTRWAPVTLLFYGAPAKLKIKALSKREAAPFFERMRTPFLSTTNTEKPDDEKALLALKEWDDFTADTFGRFVRLVEPLQDADDLAAPPITDPQDLAAQASPAFINLVLRKIQELAALGVVEGEASGSPSTSTAASGQTQASTGSPAPNTESADSTASSTATASRESVPSLSPA